MDKRIFLSSPHMSGHEMNYIKEAFDTNWIAPLGKNVNEFENAVSSYIGRKYALALSSGTAAIHLGLKYLGVSRGDVVFCQSFTFSASCNPAVYEGAKLVFIDSEPDSWNMCPKALAKAYEKYPHPKAVIIVNLYGRPAKYEELLAITKSHGTAVLEDAAESLGSAYKGVQTGNFGDISVFSFNGNKIITTSGGGMVMTDSAESRQKMLFWATQSREAFPWYEHRELGFNYRLSNICAGIGRGQMTALGERVRQKRFINSYYTEAFKNSNIISMVADSENCVSNCWLSVALVKGECISPIDIVNKLNAKNIEARLTWKPMHMQPYFSDCEIITAEECECICENLFKQGICLPSDTKMTHGELEYVVSEINKITRESA